MLAFWTWQQPPQIGTSNRPDFGSSGWPFGSIWARGTIESLTIASLHLGWHRSYRHWCSCTNKMNCSRALSQTFILCAAIMNHVELLGRMQCMHTSGNSPGCIVCTPHMPAYKTSTRSLANASSSYHRRVHCCRHWTALASAFFSPRHFITCVKCGKE